MKVAILGAGFAGLAVSWYVTHYTLGAAHIDLLDPNPIGMGASRISLGLLNPYMGKKATRAWESNNSLRETHRLITESANTLNSPLVLSKGILRPASSDQQILDFQKCAEENRDVQWWDKKRCEKKIPGLQLPAHGGGIYIADGLTVNVEKYLDGLWRACMRHGANYQTLTVLKKDQLAPYDHVVIAMGASSLDFEILQQLPMSRVKGQIIQLQWPDTLAPLPMSLSGRGQIVMAPDRKSCFVGSTYERDFTDLNTDPEYARAEILGKVAPYFPALEQMPMLGCQARLRGTTKSRLPLVGKLNEKIWFITGLGSKGLFYHGWAAKQLAQAMLMNDTSYVLEELFCPMPEFGAPPQQS